MGIDKVGECVDDIIVSFAWSITVRKSDYYYRRVDVCPLLRKLMNALELKIKRSCEKKRNVASDYSF